MCEELKKPWNDEESMDDACKNIVTIMNDAIAEESYLLMFNKTIHKK